MTSDTLILLAVLLLAFCIYYPIAKIAKSDMAERNRAGLSSTPILYFLMLPIVGPLVYMLVRKRFLPK